MSNDSLSKIGHNFRSKVVQKLGLGLSRKYWSYLKHHVCRPKYLKKSVSILAGIMKTGLSYLVKNVSSQGIH